MNAKVHQFPSSDLNDFYAKKVPFTITQDDDCQKTLGAIFLKPSPLCVC